MRKILRLRTIIILLSLTLFLPILASAQINLSEDLLFYANLDFNGTPDFSDVTVTSDTGSPNTTCQIGGCLFFDGTLEVIYADNDIFTYGTNNITYNFWYFPTVNPGVRRAMLGYGTPSVVNDTTAYSIFQNDNTIDHTTLSASEQVAVTTTVNTWFMLTAVKTNGRWQLFRNGTSIGSGFVQPGFTNLEQFTLGFNVGDQQHVGSLDEVGIWNKSMNASEISALYNNGAGVQIVGALAPEPPAFTTVNNNGTGAITGDTVNWTTDITNNINLSTCWFTHNDSGVFVNETIQSCTTSPFTFDQSIIITALDGQQVCGFFTANNTDGNTGQSQNSCFVVADSTAPTFSTVTNNGTGSLSGATVNWTVTISDATELSTCWFTHNDTGTFVNATVQACTTPFIFDQAIVTTAIIGAQVCGFFGANDTESNQGISGTSCYTVAAPPPPNVPFFENLFNIVVFAFLVIVLIVITFKGIMDAAQKKK